MFVYVDPGHDTSTALRSWGAAHRGLWHALENQGRSVEVVAVARTSREMDRALAVMSGWAEASGPGEPDAGIREELDRIERAILQGAIQILEEFGGLQAALKRSVALEKQARRQAGRGAIHRGVAWQTVRLAGARKRRGGKRPMRTLALRRCAPLLRCRPRHGNVLRLHVHAESHDASYRPVEPITYCITTLYGLHAVPRIPHNVS